MRRRSAVIKNLLGTCLHLAGNAGYAANELIVVNYHGTPKNSLSSFETQLSFYEQSFEIVSPDILNRFFGGHREHRERPMLLLTFDDGIKNNLYAVDLLQRRNIKALFSVIPGFIETAPSRQKEFLTSNVMTVVKPGVSHRTDDLSAMTWQDLSSLLGDGHAIASHTYTHRLRQLDSTPENSEYEIVESKKHLESRLGCSVQSYTSPVNTLLSTGKTEMQFIKHNYSFHFSTFPGSNQIEKDPYFIKRTNTEASWPLGIIKYSIGKFDWIRWRADRARFRSVCS